MTKGSVKYFLGGTAQKSLPGGFVALKRALFLLVTLALPLIGGEKGLTVIGVRSAWEKYPQADFGSNAMKLDPLSADTVNQLTTKHTAQLRLSRLAYLSNFAKTSLTRDGGFKTYVEVGMAYAQSLFYPEALEWMQKALALNGNSSFVYNNLANVYYLSGNTQQALAYYQQALAISRNDPRTLLNLAFIYYETGHGDLARKHYLKAIVIDPSLDRPEYQVLAGEEKTASNPTGPSSAAIR